MIQPREFDEGLARILRSMGFVAAANAFGRESAGVTTLIASQKGFGEQWFINVGFWLHALGDMAPTKVEKTHIYGRLERLFPEFREGILTAGALDDPRQEECYHELIVRLSGVIIPSLCGLATPEGLQDALKVGRLGQCLVTMQGREHLTRLAARPDKRC